MQATSVRFDEDTFSRLDNLAGSMNCSRASLIKKAVDRYLDYDAWYRGELQKGLDDVQAGRVISQDDMDACIRQMGIHVD